MIVLVWSLKRGVIDPPEPLENSAEIEALWKSYEDVTKDEPVSYWRERFNVLPPTASACLGRLP